MQISDESMYKIHEEFAQVHFEEPYSEYITATSSRRVRNLLEYENWSKDRCGVCTRYLTPDGTATIEEILKAEGVSLNDASKLDEWRLEVGLRKQPSQEVFSKLLLKEFKGVKILYYVCGEILGG